MYHNRSSVNWILQCLCLCLSIALIHGKLKSCSDTLTKPQICRKSKDYESFRVPRPIPRKLESILDIKDILEVNEDEMSMNIHIYIILKWIDPQLDYQGPEGEK